MIVDKFPDRCIELEGEEYLYFGGTNYLGMAKHPGFQALLSKNILKWGSNYGSSRSANVQLGVYGKVESSFASQLGAEAALTLSSGTLAGNLVMDYLLKTPATFFHVPKTHPAILVKNSQPLFKDGKLHEQLLDHVREEIVISTDAILSLEVRPTSFDFLKEIAPEKQITLLLDESHSLGICGEKGEGISRALDKGQVKRLIVVSSLGKALALSAGLIAGDEAFIEALKKEAAFIAASGANPAYIATYLDAKDLYKEQYSKLSANLKWMAKNLKSRQEIKFNRDYPVIYLENDAIFKTLLNEKIIITRFDYPTYKSPMNRIVISASHKKNDLELLIKILNNYEP